jgi:hypothetical protein
VLIDKSKPSKAYFNLSPASQDEKSTELKAENTFSIFS